MTLLILSCLLLNARSSIMFLLISTLPASELVFVGSVDLMMYFLQVIGRAAGSSMQVILVQHQVTRHVQMASNLLTVGVTSIVSMFCFVLYLKPYWLVVWHKGFLSSEQLNYLSMILIASSIEVACELMMSNRAAKKQAGIVALSSLMAFLGPAYYGVALMIGVLDQISLSFLGQLFLTTALARALIFIPGIIKGGVGIADSSALTSKILRNSWPLIILGFCDHLGTVMMYRVAGSIMDTLSMSYVYLLFNLLGMVPGMGLAMAAINSVGSALGGAISSLYQEGKRMAINISILSLFCVVLLLFARDAVFREVFVDTELIGAFYVLMLCLPFHIGAQVMTKGLLTLDQGGAAAIINLAWPYGLKLPLLIVLAWVGQLSLLTFWIVVLLEKAAKYMHLMAWWYITLRRLEGRGCDPLRKRVYI